MGKMMITFYTIGYSGRTAQELQQIVNNADGALLDIRISPRSRKVGFNRRQLESLFGDNYLWTPEFGNAALDTGGIELHDPASGLEMIRAIYEDSIADEWNGAVFLMCACADAATCHRAVVAELLREHGYEVTEWTD